MWNRKQRINVKFWSSQFFIELNYFLFKIYHFIWLIIYWSLLTLTICNSLNLDFIININTITRNIFKTINNGIIFAITKTFKALCFSNINFITSWQLANEKDSYIFIFFRISCFVYFTNDALKDMILRLYVCMCVNVYVYECVYKCMCASSWVNKLYVEHLD